MKSYERTSRKRPAIRQNYNTKFATYANTRGAPSLPDKRTYSQLQKVTRYRANYLDELVTFIKKAHKKGGLVIVGVNILTNHKLIHALQGGDSIVVVDKFHPYFPLTLKYNQIRCRARRFELPGDCFPHLHRQDQQNDYGMIDGVRLLGSYKGSHTPLKENEKRPSMHLKEAAALYREGETYTPREGIYGSPNWSATAELSFEDVSIIEDPRWAMDTYKYLAYLYSLSSGIGNVSRDIAPTYDWLKKKVRKSTPPACTACGSRAVVPWWDFDAVPNTKFLVCTECEEVSNRTYLLPEQPRK